MPIWSVSRMIRGTPPRGWSDVEMPVLRYFVFVGGVLLALLFVSNAYAPPQPVAAKADTVVAAENPTLRIRSDRKWPQAIVFDTTQPIIVPAPVLKAEANGAPANVAEMSPKARVRETFAQFVTVDPKPEPKQPQRKRKIANAAGSRMAQVAQPTRFGVFGNNIW
jgi:hypothetical protein